MITTLLFFIPLFLGIGMGCAWAFVALWNFVHHGPPGVPHPRRTPSLRSPNGGSPSLAEFVEPITGSPLRSTSRPWIFLYWGHRYAAAG